MLRAITKLSEIRERSVVRSSVIPSAKYSCSGSLDRFAKGRTTMESRGAAGVMGAPTSLLLMIGLIAAVTAGSDAKAAGPIV